VLAVTTPPVQAAREWVECKHCGVFMPASYVIYHELDSRPRCPECHDFVDDVL